MRPALSRKCRLFFLTSLLLLMNPIFSEALAVTEIPKNSGQPKAYPYHHFLTLAMINGYQNFISPSKVGNCPMHPSCSSFGKQAFSHHNPLLAYAMATDRVMRCGHEKDHYPPVNVNGFFRYWDPISESMALPQTVSLITSASFHSDTNPTPHTSEIVNGPLLKFALDLMAHNDHDLAITELKRYLYYFPTAEDRNIAERALLSCYVKTANYHRGLDLSFQLLTQWHDPDNKMWLNYQVGFFSYNLTDFQRAIRYTSLAVKSEDDDLRQHSQLLLGLSCAHSYKWPEAITAFSDFDHDSVFFNQSQTCLSLSRQALDLKPRSATTAGLLSIIPGLGYLYTGHKRTAISAFIVNSLFMWGTYEAFKNHNNGFGTAMAVFSFGWYSGNIYGSVRTARNSYQDGQDHILRQMDLEFE